MWLTSEQAVQVMSGSRRQGDLQESFDDIQAFALFGRLSLRSAWQASASFVTGSTGEQTAGRDTNTLPHRHISYLGRTSTHIAKSLRRAFVKSLLPSKVARLLC